MYQTLASMNNQLSLNQVNQNTALNSYMQQPNREVKVYNAPSVMNSTGKTNVTKPSHLNTNVSPQVWGRALWFSLHFGALNYPDDANDEKKQMMRNFILGLPIMIPCDVCKNHAYEYIQSKKNTLHNVVQNSRNLFKFFWEFHNDVNHKTGKPTMTLEAVYNLYRTNPTSAL